MNADQTVAQFILMARRQNGESWAADNQAIDTKLAEIRARNGGKPPNINALARERLENLPPETLEMLEVFLSWQPKH